MVRGSGRSSPALSASALLALGCGAYQAGMSRGFEFYSMYIPNGDKVMVDGQRWYGVGHWNRLGGAADNSGLNPFGVKFHEQGKSWTQALCWDDSDGDGQTNGFELGDPDCIWTLGRDPTRTVNISHPGIQNSKTHSKPLNFNDTVVLKSFAGQYVGESGGVIKANRNKNGAAKFLIQSVPIEDLNSTAVVQNSTRIFLKLWSTGMRVSIQGDSHSTTPELSAGEVHAHWDNALSWEELTIEKYLGGPVYDNDAVSFRGHFGTLVSVDESAALMTATDGTANWDPSMNFRIQIVQHY